MSNLHLSHLSKTFWETLTNFLYCYQNVLIGDIEKSFVSQKTAVHPTTISAKCFVHDDRGAILTAVCYMSHDLTKALSKVNRAMDIKKRNVLGFKPSPCQTLDLILVLGDSWLAVPTKSPRLCVDYLVHKNINLKISLKRSTGKLF